MGSVTSLGLSSPVGLAYAIQEGYLPVDPPDTSYKLHNYTNYSGNFSFENDELLVTPRCVIWSRRGIFRKCYNFDLEKETVSHALLTTFPSVGPLAGKQTNSMGTEENAGSREAAIVVFLQTQAHVYFLFGTSHIIHLPFEVEAAFAAPTGVIMQRKIGIELLRGPLASPRAQYKSTISPQSHSWSGTSSLYSSFSTADLGDPKEISLKPLARDISNLPYTKPDTNWPRLFSLSDPLAEIGLIVSQQLMMEGKGYGKKPSRILHLDTAEEILYVSHKDDFYQSGTVKPLVLALTWNLEACKYTVWKFEYAGDNSSINDRIKIMGRNSSHCRSSYVPLTATGNSTPVSTGQQNLREFSHGNQSLNLRKSLRNDGSLDKVVDLVSSLDPDFEGQSIPRRRSRRVSSMLARADLSKSHERSAFSDLATGQQHIITRRRESLSSQHTRNSLGAPEAPIVSTLSNQTLKSRKSLNGSTELHVDGAIDKDCNGGNFEEFNSLELEDGEFSTLKQEIFLTKIGTISPLHSTVKFSVQKKTAVTLNKVFTVAAPSCTAFNCQGASNIVCIFDPDERRLNIITLNTKIDESVGGFRKRKNKSQEKEVTVVSLGPVLRVENVIDACRIDDASISRILILSTSASGHGELTIQAPWSVTMKVQLPSKFSVINNGNLNQELQYTSQEREFKGISAFHGLRNSRPPGYVDLLDGEGNLHQIHLLLKPRNPYVSKILETCTELLPLQRDVDSNSTSRVDGILACWWDVLQWLRSESIDASDLEETALVITLFAVVFGIDHVSGSVRKSTHIKNISHFKLSSRKSRQTIGSWGMMLSEEAQCGNLFPPWAANCGWAWLADGVDIDCQITNSEKLTSVFERDSQDFSFIQKHVQLTHHYIQSASGQKSVLKCLPTWVNNTLDARIIAIQDLMIGLHLLREEQKLNIINSDCFSTGRVNLITILAQIARWLKWSNWVGFYADEEASLIDSDFDNDSPIKLTIQQPFECPSVYDWLQRCFSTRSSLPLITISDILSRNPEISLKYSQDRCKRLTPRTLIFKQFFELVLVDWIPAQVVESFSSAGGDALMLETLPETILAPLQEAIIHCQSAPPSNWSKSLLALVGREDVNMSLIPGQKPRVTQPKILVSSHTSHLDMHRICMSVSDTEAAGSFDGTVEVHRQSVTRLIFKDDRRINEAIEILDTTRSTYAICKSEPQWSESDLLEAQKDHAQVLAYRTLAIPSGRGLLYFSSRIPLLTQKWNINGFNLSYIMKPENNVVTVDKSAFTEEKVCWAFFHAGVTAGLQISRDAKGIDTSWILYNKPQPDLLNNSHSGFLLALGLNGHLKSVAKWVAFKYLTPKHTMTSIGLLLGLSASYIGTMDSLVTRLLSVHVTRMLPLGAAELNLSPLTQTTGIMGIGLVYCNTQHRRMTEIMVSEIEHIDTETEENPLRNEAYRLAAGFALGLINLGKGSDLKGLHDIRLTERLLSLATGSKKVDLVHVLDKATAAAVMGIALIFMKSENQILARKVNVPDSFLQFDYVRPDIFLLRTVASHLIMWNKITPSFEWILENLPKIYRHKSSLESIDSLNTEDLAFYNIITGLCFSISLRFAGSVCLGVRDILVHYLDQLMRICRLEATTYDQKLTKNTVRTCQDLLALSATTVMAGSGDLVVFRRLRSLHGRDDSETPYGSHLAAHIAIGGLFLGGGTFTFGTSNLAIAALLIAFYPITPSSIHDNSSHLQAFRHFWTLAAEPRCLVAKDIDTGQPVSLPVIVTPLNGDEFIRISPCLLPEINQIKSIRTDSSDFWNLSLDLENNPTHMAAFKSRQTIYVRRRPAHSSASNTFQASFQALSDAESKLSHPLEWIFDLSVFASLTKAERELILPSHPAGGSDINAEIRGTVVDARLVLENSFLESGKKDRLLGLKLLFDWVDQAAINNQDTHWIRSDLIDKMKTKMWIMMMQED